MAWDQQMRRPALLRRLQGGHRERTDLEIELDHEIGWMYPWQIDGRAANLMHPELPSVHDARRQMIEQTVREALAAAGPGASALDIACSEGWFSHRLLEWGASTVVGVDVRELNVRRASLVRDHHGIPEEQLRFVQSDVFDLSPQNIGTFDVVLMLGLIYHLEDPVGAVRVARSLTESLCVIESQLTRQDDPVEHGWGVTDVVLTAAPSFAALVEADEEINPIASSGGVMSLIPNRVALEQMCLVAGFETVSLATAPAGVNRQYVEGDRGIVFAHQAGRG